MVAGAVLTLRIIEPSDYRAATDLHKLRHYKTSGYTLTVYSKLSGLTTV